MTDDSSLPDGTARVMLLHDSLTVSLDDEDDVPDQARVVSSAHSGGTEHTVVEFAKGDEIPLDVARDCWDAFSDRLAALDDENTRLDTPDSNEKRGFDTSVFSW